MVSVILFTLFAGVGLIDYWMNQKALFYQRRTQLAHAVHQEYLQLSGQTYALFRQLVDAAIIIGQHEREKCACRTTGHQRHAGSDSSSHRGGSRPGRRAGNPREGGAPVAGRYRAPARARADGVRPERSACCRAGGRSAPKRRSSAHWKRRSIATSGRGSARPWTAKSRQVSGGRKCGNRPSAHTKPHRSRRGRHCTYLLHPDARGAATGSAAADRVA